MAIGSTFASTVFEEAACKINDQVDQTGQSMRFCDDPLDAGGFGPNDVLLKIRPSAARSQLIRPRVQFVTEMLKSVENM
jgi:hypothetical protein